MKTHARAAGLLALLCLSAAQAAPPAAKKKAPAPPPALGVSGEGMTMTLPDPKFPGSGKLLYYLRAAGADGQTNPDGSFHGRMTKLWVRLYQKGIPSAVLSAPLAVGGGTGRAIVLTGQGGVVVHSLSEPGTILTADTVAWHSASNQVVATGHVFYHSGKNGGTLTGARAVADTALRTLQIGAGHARERF